MSNTPEGDKTQDNVYLFPNMLDHYQFQLTRMLEAEQYEEARELLQFLLHCKGEDQRHYEEWSNLLKWVEMAFPESLSEQSRNQPSESEDELRKQVLSTAEQDEEYINQVLYIMKNHPMIDQQMLALERAALLDSDIVSPEIRAWLASSTLHPVVQFKALQCLRRRGEAGMMALERLGEQVQLEIEATPLALEDFPQPVLAVLERVERVTEVIDASLPHFARELWRECLQFLYGTSTYNWMLDDRDEMVDCFAAALHLALAMAAYGKAEEEEIRELYGITESLRFRYEQACRMMRLVADGSQGPGNDSES
ncbi:hypothetical protein [Paenibacillus sp. 1P07SE]|uniref:hypothetical protein n=1 Tax=Paenibacillus sp. 1P07SE TaxID=3132209 RepID=UPI0039A60DE3